MPLLLAIPLAVIIALAVFVVLFPLSLLQRFRMGTAPRQARGWLLMINLVSAGMSSVLFLIFSLVAAAFWPGAISHAAFGWACGLALGVLALRLTRFERTTQGLFYRPNLWLMLALTALVVVRVIAGWCMAGAAPGRAQPGRPRDGSVMPVCSALPASCSVMRSPTPPCCGGAGAAHVCAAAFIGAECVCSLRQAMVLD